MIFFISLTAPTSHILPKCSSPQLPTQGLQIGEDTFLQSYALIYVFNDPNFNVYSYGKEKKNHSVMTINLHLYLIHIPSLADFVIVQVSSLQFSRVWDGNLVLPQSPNQNQKLVSPSILLRVHISMQWKMMKFQGTKPFFKLDSL